MLSRTKKIVSCVLASAIAAPTAAFAQSSPSQPSQAQQPAPPLDTSTWTPPPMVDASPGTDPSRGQGTPPPPGSAVPQAPLAGATPMPPGYQQPPPSTVAPAYMPGSTLMPYGSQPLGPAANNPYGVTLLDKPPPPEIGLMVTETLFGGLTSTGTTLVAWFLGVKLMAPPPGTDPDGTGAMITNIVFFSSFAGAALAVAETESSIASGSRDYTIDSWIPTLTALLTQAAVIGVYELVRAGPNPLPDGGEALLLVGSCAAVPLVTMGAINLFKTPRFKIAGVSGIGSLMQYSPDSGLHAALPTPSPILVQTGRGPSLGLGVSLLSGKF